MDAQGAGEAVWRQTGLGFRVSVFFGVEQGFKMNLGIC